jgi:hypothetical protein
MSQLSIMDLHQTKVPNKFTCRWHSRYHFHFQFRYHWCDHFRANRVHFRGHSKFQSQDSYQGNSQVSSPIFPLQHTASEGGLQQCRCEGVGEHLSSLYAAQVDLSISSRFCSKTEFGRNVCNCYSTIHSVVDVRDQ